MELEHVLQRNAAIRCELASDDPDMNQEISSEWYYLYVIYYVVVPCANMLLQGENIQPVLKASCQVSSKERAAQDKVCG